ncbi:hypothetical protein AB4Y45_35015 [Paraburkholderia sp. EG287A]|uniref:hypothetical protein n=1 Tax=Paraburkholderia sp. EG287A TaxID=3237012 RepID=UPI0034D156F8
MSLSTPLTNALLEKLRLLEHDKHHERGHGHEESRERMREWVAHLRDASTPHSYEPASTSTPTFKIGDVKGFPFVTERAESTPGIGNLSPDGSASFMNSMRDASTRSDPVSRDAATGRAAKVVSKEWAHLHGYQNAGAELLHKARAQVTFAAREIGQKLGIGPVESTAIGYSLERALEREGFRVIASHAIDRAADVFRSSVASVAGAAGMRAATESTFGKSMTWLAEHGVTSQLLKDGLTKHMGKVTAIVEVAQHPEAIRRVAQIIANSDTVLHAVMKLGTDVELRKAIGNLTLASGEAMTNGPGLLKVGGSAAMVVGSLLRGDSSEQTERHIFRAALSLLGGAAGGAALGAVSGGFGAAAGGIVGAEVGARLADKLLNLYDGYKGQAAQHDNVQVSHADLRQSMNVLEQRAEKGAEQKLASMAKLNPDMEQRMKDMGGVRGVENTAHADVAAGVRAMGGASGVEDKLKSLADRAPQLEMSLIKK